MDRATLERHLAQAERQQRPALLWGGGDEHGYRQMDRFIARENIKHFRDRLRLENDPDVRSRLHELLVAEEDKLGADLELLADLDRHILDGHRRLEWQHALVANMERDGHNRLPQARRLLDGLMDSQVLHQEYRRRVQIRIEQSRL